MQHNFNRASASVRLCNQLFSEPGVIIHRSRQALSVDLENLAFTLGFFCSPSDWAVFVASVFEPRLEKLSAAPSALTLTL